ADNEVVINEINTLPGFTNISMYPKLWQASGLGYTDLISRLIDSLFPDALPARRRYCRRPPA
ncbi:hypothetical protein MJM59_32130, partial [Salmonella enterica subsp. enterica serovar Montevideo]|nr:hypothetical protein [Salmonella enterica subsp. enterica serovar Montevideo]